MSNTFFILMIITMMAVLVSLAIGVFGMAKGGDFNKKHANKLMRARVYLQAGALLFFFMAIALSKK